MQLPPMISISLTTASAAASICRSRSGSSALILQDCGRHRSFPNIRAELPGCPQIDLASHKLGYLDLHAGKFDQTRHVPGLKFYQHVYVALLAKPLRKNRPEQRKLPHMISNAERRNVLLRN